MWSPLPLSQLCSTVIGKMIPSSSIKYFIEQISANNDSMYIDDHMLIMICKEAFPKTKQDIYTSGCIKDVHEASIWDQPYLFCNHSILYDVVQTGFLLSGCMKDANNANMHVNISVEFDRRELIKTACSFCIIKSGCICRHVEKLCHHRISKPNEVIYLPPIIDMMRDMPEDILHYSMMHLLNANLRVNRDEKANINEIALSFDRFKSLPIEEVKQLTSQNDLKKSKTIWELSLDRVVSNLNENKLSLSQYQWISHGMEFLYAYVKNRSKGVDKLLINNYLSMLILLFEQEKFYKAATLSITAITVFIRDDMSSSYSRRTMANYLLKLFIDGLAMILNDPRTKKDRPRIIEFLENIEGYRNFRTNNANPIFNYWAGDISMKNLIVGYDPKVPRYLIDELFVSIGLPECPRNTARELYSYWNRTFLEGDFQDYKESVWLTAMRVVHAIRFLHVRHKIVKCILRCPGFSKLSYDLLFHLASGIACNLAPYSILNEHQDIEAYGIDELFPNSDFIFEEVNSSKEFNQIQCVYYLLVFVDAIVMKQKNDMAERRTDVPTLSEPLQRALISLCLITLEHSRIMYSVNDQTLLFRNRYEWVFLINSLQHYIANRNNLVCAIVTEKAYLHSLRNKSEMYSSNIPPYDLLYSLLFCFRDYASQTTLTISPNGLDRSARLHLGKCAYDQMDFDYYVQKHHESIVRERNLPIERRQHEYIGELTSDPSSVMHQCLIKDVFSEMLMADKQPFANCKLYSMLSVEDGYVVKDSGEVLLYEKSRWKLCNTYLKIAKVYLAVCWQDRDYFHACELFDYFTKLDLNPPGMVYIKGIGSHLSFMRQVWFSSGTDNYPTYNSTMDIYDFENIKNKQCYLGQGMYASSDEDNDDEMVVSDFLDDGEQEESNGEKEMVQGNGYHVELGAYGEGDGPYNGKEEDEESNLESGEEEDNEEDDDMNSDSEDNQREESVAIAAGNDVNSGECEGDEFEAKRIKGESLDSVHYVKELNVLGYDCESCPIGSQLEHASEGHASNVTDDVERIAKQINLHKLSFKQSKMKARILSMNQFSLINAPEKLECLKISLFAIEIAVNMSDRTFSFPAKTKIFMRKCMSMGPSSLMLFKSNWCHIFPANVLSFLLRELKNSFPGIPAFGIYLKVAKYIVMRSTRDSYQNISSVLISIFMRGSPNYINFVECVAQHITRFEDLLIIMKMVNYGRVHEPWCNELHRKITKAIFTQLSMNASPLSELVHMHALWEFEWMIVNIISNNVSFWSEFVDIVCNSREVAILKTLVNIVVRRKGSTKYTALVNTFWQNHKEQCLLGLQNAYIRDFRCELDMNSQQNYWKVIAIMKKEEEFCKSILDDSSFFSRVIKDSIQGHRDCSIFMNIFNLFYTRTFEIPDIYQ